MRDGCFIHRLLPCTLLAEKTTAGRWQPAPERYENLESEFNKQLKGSHKLLERFTIHSLSHTTNSKNIHNSNHSHSIENDNKIVTVHRSLPHTPVYPGSQLTGHSDPKHGELRNQNRMTSSYIVSFQVAFSTQSQECKLYHGTLNDNPP